MLYVIGLSYLVRCFYCYNNGINVLEIINYFIIRFEDYRLLYEKEYMFDIIELFKRL